MTGQMLGPRPWFPAVPHDGLPHTTVQWDHTMHRKHCTVSHTLSDIFLNLLMCGMRCPLVSEAQPRHNSSLGCTGKMRLNKYNTILMDFDQSQNSYKKSQVLLTLVSKLATPNKNYGLSNFDYSENYSNYIIGLLKSY